MKRLFTAGKSTVTRMVRAASVLAAVGLVLVGAPRPAAADGIGDTVKAGAVNRTNAVLVAQPSPPAPWVSAPYSLNFTRLQCISESGEWGSDEPYVYIFVGDLKNPSASQVFRTRIFGDVDSGENRYQSVALWGATIPQGDPNNLVILAQVMEHDYSNPSEVLSGLQGTLPSRLNGYVRSGLSRSAIVSAMKYDMWDTIIDADDLFTLSAFSFDNLDDRVGMPQELRITTNDMQTAYNGGPVEHSLYVDGGGDGKYRTYYELRRS
jgi:hypothetical protein